MDLRACDDEELVNRCDGCGGVLEPWDDEHPVIYDCFHALHAGCAHGHDACPRCHTPRLVHDDVDDQQPDNNNPSDEYSALASDGMGKGNDDDRPRGGGEKGDGDLINDASHLACSACCSHRVTELENRFEEKSADLTETTSVLAMELDRAQSRLCKLEEMYDKLEEELIRLRDGGREKSMTPARIGRSHGTAEGASQLSSFPLQQDQTD